MNTIAVKIKELRKSLNLTQKEFCERVGISQGYLSALEKNPERSNCLIRFLYYTSMRIHQALSLTWSNVLWEQEVITIKRKGRKEHYQFPITRQIEAVLNKLPRDREHIFPWGVNSRSRLYKRLQHACDELGIDRDGRAFHVFRKTRITKLAEKNMFLTSQSADVSPKTMNANYIRNKSAREMKEFLEQE